jgi:hypothetical protein
MTDPLVKRALLIGIDKYPYLSVLDGCVNDVRSMRVLLEERFGFPKNNVTLITDQEATREAILVELDALVTRTGRDDVVVIHYAGHGSQMTDRERDEPSGYDNTIMPYDSQGWRGINRDITDDEINIHLQRLASKTSNITLVFDSCHSGSITRNGLSKSRGQEADRRPVSELPPSPIRAEDHALLGQKGPSGWAPLADSYVLVAGCRDGETSYEYRDSETSEPHGTLSYFLLKALNDVKPGTTWRDLFQRVAATVTSINLTQHPQMEGRIDREVLGVKDIETMRFARIAQRNGDYVTMAAGAALGMTVGSRWAVHREDTKQPTESSLVGEVEIVEVRGAASTGVILSADRDGIVAGTRAVETLHSFGDLRMPVRVLASPGLEAHVAPMTERLSQSPLLRVMTAAEADLPTAVRVIATQQGAELAPTVQGAPAQFWTLLTATGELLPPVKPLAALDDVKRNAETIARYRHAMALENPDPQHTLRDTVSFEVLRRAGNGSWIVAEPESAGGGIVFEVGEAIGWRIRNSHTAPVYISLLDFTLSGKVALLHPPLGAQELVRAHAPDDEPFEIGTDPTKRKLKMTTEPNAITSVDTFKLFVTTTPTDFSFLAQQGVRSAFPSGRKQSPLALLLETAKGSMATRAAVDVATEDVEEWTTVTRAVHLRAESPIRRADVSPR